MTNMGCGCIWIMFDMMWCRAAKRKSLRPESLQKDENTRRLEKQYTEINERNICHLCLKALPWERLIHAHGNYILY